MNLPPLLNLFIRHRLWLIPLLFFMIFAPFTAEWDLACSRYFYQPFAKEKGEFLENAFTHFFYHYGEYFAFTCSGIAAFIFVASWWIARFKKLRRGALALFLVFVLGAGLITNGILKEYWGRPRPKQIVEFGGHHDFRPFYQPMASSHEDPMKSFPSGHATVGFYFCSLCFVARRYGCRWLFYVGLILTMGLGLSLSFSRVAQGAHYLSDVVTAALVMWYTALFIDRLLFKKKEISEQTLL